jgi:hypothetical protein
MYVLNGASYIFLFPDEFQLALIVNIITVVSIFVCGKGV